MAITNSINNKVGGSNSGATNTFTVDNASNTASSAATCLVTVGGSTAADPAYQSVVSGVTTWTWGIDNSVTSPTADPFVISQGTALGTNNIMSVATSGEINFPLQCAFMAYLQTTDSNATGDGTVYTLGAGNALVEIFDQNSDFNTNGTFTAPVTGRYQFCVVLAMDDVGASMSSFEIILVTTNRSVYGNQGSAANWRDVGNRVVATLSFMTDMDATDTATVTLTVSGSTKTVDITGNTTVVINGFSGYLAC